MQLKLNQLLTVDEILTLVKVNIKAGGGSAGFD